MRPPQDMSSGGRFRSKNSRDRYGDIKFNAYLCSSVLSRSLSYRPYILRHFCVEVRGKTWNYMRLIFLKMLVTAGFIGFWEDIRSYKIRPVPSDS